MNVPDLERFGPFFFKILMNVITSNTEEAILTLTSKLSTFKITSIQGENITRQSTSSAEQIDAWGFLKKCLMIFLIS